jgi:hypothetical protein
LSTSYERPSIRDYGTIASITQASGFVQAEDGGSKLLIHHSAPAGP